MRICWLCQCETCDLLLLAVVIRFPFCSTCIINSVRFRSVCSICSLSTVSVGWCSSYACHVLIIFSFFIIHVTIAEALGVSCVRCARWERKNFWLCLSTLQWKHISWGFLNLKRNQAGVTRSIFLCWLFNPQDRASEVPELAVLASLTLSSTISQLPTFQM